MKYERCVTDEGFITSGCYPPEPPAGDGWSLVGVTRYSHMARGILLRCFWQRPVPQEAPPAGAACAHGPETQQEQLLVKRLFDSANIEDALEARSNAELADLLTDHIWSTESMFTGRAALLEVVIERLRNTALPDEDQPA